MDPASNGKCGHIFHLGFLGLYLLEFPLHNLGK